jgi:hypothetical protein
MLASAQIGFPRASIYQEVVFWAGLLARRIHDAGIRGAPISI